MNTYLIPAIVILYFLVLMVISHFTNKGSNRDTFFTGNRQSPWLLVAFGMVGAGLSGVTFVSVPGMVGNNYLYFYQFILGNIVGYIFITYVLIPLYFKLKLVSIYTYLDNRFGGITYKTGSLFFIISQSFGASLRFLLATKIMQYAFFDRLEIPFTITVIILLILVWLYTIKAGIKTLVWTDTLQTLFLILGALASVYAISSALNLSFYDAIQTITEHQYFNIFNWEPKSNNYFFKQFIAGILIAVSMIGLDQNMMQKTLTCKSQKDAQKNTLTYSMILAFTQFLFLGLGIILYIYAKHQGVELDITEDGRQLNTDSLFPNLALNHLGIVARIFFLLGIIAAAFSSVDSSLTALTTSFTHDFLDIKNKKDKQKDYIKKVVHIWFSILIFVIIMLFSNSQGDVITLIFSIAGYTYGPLLGIYLVGMFSKLKVNDRFVPLVCILSPIITYFSGEYLKTVYNFNFGFVNIAVNAIITIIGLYLIKQKHE